MSDTNATMILPRLPMELEKKLSLLEALRLDLDLPCMHTGKDTEPTLSSTTSETNTLNERRDSSMTSPRTSICSSNTSNCSNSNINPVAKPVKRVRFEESVSCSFFEENLDHLSRPTLERKPSLITRGWDRITSRNSSTDSSISATSQNNPYTVHRHSISVDLLDVGSKPVRRPTLPDRSQSYTIQQPLRESAGRRYSGAETIACFRAKPATAKGDWDDLLGPRTA